MVFTSTVFLFLFLPAFLLVYRLTPARHRSVIILLGSYLFYAWWRPDFALVFAASTAMAIVAGRLIGRWRGSDDRKARLALTFGVAAQLAVLAYFKYADFGIGSLNALLNAMGASPIPLVGVVLPVGISFYVFQAICYLADVARGDARPDARWTEVAAYISLFPQLIAGPIVRFKSVAETLRAPHMDLHGMADGAGRFMLGFVKKVLVADAIAPIANGAFALGAPTAAEAWLGALAFAVQLLFDFSGYSDMAIGLGRMLGFGFPENFDRPYRANSITDFWRRWHMSLSGWLRDYLYIPLGGNRRGATRTYINLALVMVLGGLWHGPTWNFVLWGAWHGGLLATERAVRGRGGRGLPPGIGMALTFLAVLVGWVLFRAPDLSAALSHLLGMAGVNGWGLSSELLWQIQPRAVITLAVGLALSLLPTPATVGPRLLAVLRASLVPLFLLAVARAVTDTASPFLYFRF